MMVDYFYTFDYPDPLSAVPAPDAATTTTARPRNAFEAHSHVFTLADKYDVPGLCELAYAKFIAAMKPTLGYTHTFCSELAANLLLAIPHVYANAPPQDDRLRKAVLAPWKADSLKLLKYVDAVALEEVVRAEPGFAVELLAGIAGVEIGELCEGGKGDAEGKGGKDGEKTVGFAVDLPRNLFFGGGAASST